MLRLKLIHGLARLFNVKTLEGAILVIQRQRILELEAKIHVIYEVVLRNSVNPNQERQIKMPGQDTNAELTAILTYAQNSAAYIQQQNALIATLQASIAANGNTTNSDSADVEANIQAILAFQNANPVPTPPASVTPTPASPAPTDGTPAPSVS